MTCAQADITVQSHDVATMASRPRTASLRGGFALLSVMVAVVLLATGVMAIGAANTMRLRSVTRSTVRTTALNLARGFLEELRGRDPWSLATESQIAIDEAGVPAVSGRFTRQLLVTEMRPNLVRVEVIITAVGLSTPIRIVTNTYRGGTMTPRT